MVENIDNVRITIDLPQEIVDGLEEEATKQHRDRKKHIEWILTKYVWELNSLGVSEERV